MKNGIQENGEERIWERIKGGVTAAKGFQAAGVEANVKYKNRKDMAMIVSGVPCRAAGCFYQQRG